MAVLWYFALHIPGEPNMPERIIMALKLSSTVLAPAAAKDSDVGLDHEIDRKSSHFCEHQDVCEEYTSQFKFTPPGNSMLTYIQRVSIVCA